MKRNIIKFIFWAIHLLAHTLGVEGFDDFTGGDITVLMSTKDDLINIV